MKRKRLLIIGIFLVMALVLPVALGFARARPSATVWYTSPPIDDKGTRLRFRVPDDYPMRFCLANQHNGSIYENAEIYFERAVPSVLELVTPKGEVTVHVEKTLKPDAFANKPARLHEWMTVNEDSFINNPSKVASRTIYNPSLKYQVTLFYANDDWNVFERNHREITDSLTILH